MKSRSHLFIIVPLILLISSCTIYRKGTPAAPLEVRVNFSMDDLEYIGDVTGTSVQSYVIGIPVGGRRYTLGTTIAPIGLLTGAGLSRGEQNALYDALLQKPDADFILPISIESKRNVAFLGSRVTYTLRAKAFRLKSKQP